MTMHLCELLSKLVLATATFIGEFKVLEHDECPASVFTV